MSIKIAKIDLSAGSQYNDADSFIGSYEELKNRFEFVNENINAWQGELKALGYKDSMIQINSDNKIEIIVYD